MPAVFTSYLNGIEDFQSIYLLSQSIRAFAGNMNDVALRVYLPRQLCDAAKEKAPLFNGLNTSFVPYDAAAQEAEFPYAFKVLAAKAAETDIGSGTMIWFDRHSLVLGPCTDLLLAGSKVFAYRPVNLKLLSSGYDAPPDALWQTMYRIAGIGDGDIFPMVSSVDRQTIRPHFFACHFSCRAESRLLSKWFELFMRLRADEAMMPYLRDEHVRVFLHQFSLAIAVLQNVGRSQMRQLPDTYGYPTHLHQDIPPAYQAEDMAALSTAYFNGSLAMPVSKPLAAWLDQHLERFKAFRAG